MSIFVKKINTFGYDCCKEGLGYYSFGGFDTPKKSPMIVMMITLIRPLSTITQVTPPGSWELVLNLFLFLSCFCSGCLDKTLVLVAVIEGQLMIILMPVFTK